MYWCWLACYAWRVMAPCGNISEILEGTGFVTRRRGATWLGAGPMPVSGGVSGRGRFDAAGEFSRLNCVVG